MSIATLKDELLRELAVTALGDVTHHRSSMGAGTDMIDWMSGPPDVLRRAWVFRDKGPRLIVTHVPHGSRLWFAPGVYPHLCSGPKSVVVTEVVYRTNDPEGVSRIHVDVGLGPTRLSALFAGDGEVDRFLDNVLLGHVQDADVLARSAS
jgi:hypothetical protein